MLVKSIQLNNTAIMGLQTGTELARTTRPIIDPRTLAIVAYEVDGPLLTVRPSILRIADVRELSDIGMIIDSSDEFVEPGDVIKIKQVIDLNFSPIGMSVVDDKKHKLGKVDSYTIEMGSFVIQQINVRRPLLKSLSDSELLIHRSQVIEIDDTTITVKSTAKEARDPVPGSAHAYVNPFRKTGTQPESFNRSER